MHAEKELQVFRVFAIFSLFRVFWHGKKTQKTKQNKTKRNDSVGNKREVRKTYLLVTSGGRYWVCPYAADVVGEIYYRYAGSTGAADAGEGAYLDGVATVLVVDSAVALPSVPQTNRERQEGGLRRWDRKDPPGQSWIQRRLG